MRLWLQTIMNRQDAKRREQNTLRLNVMDGAA
jgi:hypothetical protein